MRHKPVTLSSSVMVQVSMADWSYVEVKQDMLAGLQLMLFPAFLKMVI